MDLAVDQRPPSRSNSLLFKCVLPLAFLTHELTRTPQSMYINQIASEHIFDLLLAIASNAETTEFGPWNMVALDIFHLIFRCVKPEELIIPLEQVGRSYVTVLCCADLWVA